MVEPQPSKLMTRVRLPSAALSGVVGDAGDVHVDALAVEGDALGHQVFALALTDGEAAVGADDAPPGEVIGDLLSREEAGGEAGRAG
jgi:hypothetical protein